MYWGRLGCPQEGRTGPRPGHFGSTGSCRSTRWYRRYAAGARLIAVPGCPEPTFCTASIARTRTRSTARLSVADQSRALVLTVIPSAVVKKPEQPPKAAGTANPRKAAAHLLATGTEPIPG